MNPKIWLIGGTSDSATIAQSFTALSIPFIVTVTTSTARTLYGDRVEIAVGCMNSQMMQSFCCQNQITSVVDASHPYAVEVSSQAIATATKLNIPYLRYERVHCHAGLKTDSIIKLDSFDRLLAGEYLTRQRVLLTVGCKALPRFDSWQSKATLFARVLPKIASLKTALAAGFTSDRLIAIRPPLSIATETALWQQWKISLVVTKASGLAGGEDLKRQVAANLNVPLVIITRPKIAYPQKTSEINEVLAFSRRVGDR